MREAVGILNSPVIISEEMHIMVVWQPRSEVTQFQISAKESHLAPRAPSPPALPAAVAWGWRSPVGGRSTISVWSRGFLLCLKCNLKQNLLWRRPCILLITLSFRG